MARPPKVAITTKMGVYQLMRAKLDDPRAEIGPDEVCVLLNISMSTAMNWCYAGKYGAVKKGVRKYTFDANMIRKEIGLDPHPAPADSAETA